MSAVMQRNPVLPVPGRWLTASARWAVSLLGMLLLGLALLMLSRFAVDPVRFPVTNVDVNGTLDYLDREHMREQIELHTTRGFYGMDVDDIRASVESMPWVSQVHVRREWPGRLVVNIAEHEPAARYNNDMLVSKSMQTFYPPQLHKDNPQFSEWQSTFAPLPRLSGGEGRHQSVLDDYWLYTKALAPLGVSIDALIEDERHSQTLELSNQITVRIGYDSHELRLQRFIDVFARLVAPLNGRPARFDMRYSNGFALSGGIEPARSF